MSDTDDSPAVTVALGAACAVAVAAPAAAAAIERRPDGLPVGRPFQPGGPPGPGRRKGFARRIREAVGDDGEELVNHALAVLRDPVAPVEERRHARQWLADRAFGRAPETIAVGTLDSEGDPAPFLPASYAPPELAAGFADLSTAELAELTAKMEALRDRGRAALASATTIDVTPDKAGPDNRGTDP